MEQLRRVIIYELFINHYIEMAKYSTPFRSFNQALIYLKQAFRLCTLLSDDDRVEQAQHYRQLIEDLHVQVVTERNRESQTKPQLPRRESTRIISNKTKFRVKAPKPPKNTDFDPYTNIDVFNERPDYQKTKASKTVPKLSIEMATAIRNQIITNIQIHSVPEPLSPTTISTSIATHSNGFEIKSPDPPTESYNLYSAYTTDDESETKSPPVVRKLNGLKNETHLQFTDNGQITVKNNQRNKRVDSDTEDNVTSL